MSAAPMSRLTKPSSFTFSVAPPTSMPEMALPCMAMANPTARIWPLGRTYGEVLLLPADHLFDPGQAPIQTAGGVHLTEIGGHDLSLTDKVLLPNDRRIHAQPVSQLVHRALHRVDALGRAEPRNASAG